MPLSKEHKAQTRARIVASAGSTFRTRGYARTSVEDVMAGAALTRGGFYAHFASKEALFDEVVATDHGLIRQLRRRSLKTFASGQRETLRLVRDYLNPAHFEVVGQGCSFAALTGEVARAGEATKGGYRAAFDEVAKELVRLPKMDAQASWARAPVSIHNQAVGAAQCVLGATVLAGALAPSASADQVLRQAWGQFRQLIRAMWQAQAARDGSGVHPEHAPANDAPA
jgi:TetR/AcrR family transcriptional repressor of nem operon